MVTVVLPVLLVLCALGGILVIVGRRLPDIREALRQGVGDDTPGDTGGVSLAPRGTTLAHPPKARPLPGVTRLKAGAGDVVRGVGSGGRIAGRALLGGLRLLSKLFHRPPVAQRVPQPATSRSTEPHGTAPQPTRTAIPTTADIQRSSGHPLRFPEPLPGEDVPSLTPVEHLGESAPREVVSPPTVGGEVSAPEPTMAESVREETIAVVSETPTGEAQEPPVEPERPEITIERTHEGPTSRRRRVVGRVRPRKARPSRGAEDRGAPQAPARAPRTREHQEKVPTVPTVDDRPAAWASTSQTIPALIEEGNLGRAESLLIDILSKDPRDTDAYRLLGTIYLKRGEHQQAQEVFEEALRRDPAHPGLYGPLGQAHLALGEYAKALSMYQRAHDADETNLEHLESLLKIASRMDRRPLVKVIVKKILAIEPNHAEAKKVLSRVETR